MNHLRRTFIAALLSLALAISAAAQAPAQGPAVRDAIEPAAPAQAERLVVQERWGGPALRIGQSYELAAGDAIRELVVILGDATIDGQVNRDVVVILGQARLSGTASVGGSLVVVGGSATVSAGATVREDMIIVGGGLTAPPAFAPGGHHVVVGPAALGGRLDAFTPWLTRGLLWGRLIVPNVPWMWAVVGLFFLIYLILNLMFHNPVGASAAVLVEKPLTGFAVGLLVLLLVGPVCLLLTLSIVGAAVVPFLLCALFITGLIGKIGVTRWVGMSVVPQRELDARLPSLRSFIVGFAVISLAYMIPILGVVTWTMVGVLGLGAATLAFMRAYRLENPLPARTTAPASLRTPVSAREQSGPLPSVGEVEVEPPSLSGPSVVTDLLLLPHAFFRERLAAFVLDVILVVIVQQVLAPRGNDGLVFLLLLAYHVGFWTWKGTTVGGIICQLRLVRVDGAPLRFVDALVRGLSSIFSLVVLGIGALWILKDPERQAWHDKIAGTYVVRVPRHHPL